MKKLAILLYISFFIVQQIALAKEVRYQRPTGVIIDVKKDKNTPELYKVFNKKIDVFGIPVYAFKGVSDRELRHVASILAEYLDNDLNGQPDNLEIIETMHRGRAAALIFEADNEDFEKVADMIQSSREHSEDLITVIYSEEIVFNNGDHGEFDASLEEIFHLITSAGYVETYPHVFGDRRGTQIAKAMDKARGGYFRHVPKHYPKGAWYAYYDDTCDYSCQTIEYLYWLVTSNLSTKGMGQDIPGRYKQIQHEWRLNTHEKVKNGDKLGYKIISNKRYKMPNKLPTGHYPFSEKRLIK